MTNFIYLDYNATAPMRPSVKDAWNAAVELPGNPSSVHAAGRAAAKFMEESRAMVAGLVGARARDVVFTSGGTEANNAVLRQTGAASLIISAVEHESVMASAKLAGIPITVVPVDTKGVVVMSALTDALEASLKPALVSVMLVNNETGIIQNMKPIVEAVKNTGAMLHVDAVQAAGKLMLNFNTLGADYVTLSAHKLGGPQGVGAIILAPVAPLSPLVAGGGQEQGRRSGTENVAGIAAFGNAAVEAMSALGDMNRIATLRDHLEASIKTECPDAVIIGADSDRVANTSCIALPGVSGETQVMHFDLAGICISSGSACSSGKVKKSHVITALGYDEDIANASIRVSLGWNSTETDIDAFIKAFKTLYDRTASKR